MLFTVTAFLPLLVILVFATPASASEEVPTLAPVTVIAPKEVAQGDPSASYTVITIDNQPSENITLSTILSTVSGINIKQYGGLGDFAVAMIRGSTPGQIVVYLDGVPISTGQNGVVNLSDIPVASLERIEVYKGTTPPRFAIAGMGGVINLVTRKTGETVADIKASYGSFNTYKASASASGGTNGFRYLVRADAQKTDGDFEYENDNGTPYNNADDTTETRQNNHFSQNAILAKGEADFKNFSLFLSDVFVEKKKGIPGLGAIQAREAYYDLVRNIVRLDVTFDPVASVTPGIDLFHTTTNERFVDREGEIGLGYQDNESDSITYGANGRVEWRPTDNKNGVTFAASFLQEIFDETNYLTPSIESPDRKREIITSTLAGEYGIEKFGFYPSIRYERLENIFEGEVFFSETAIAPNDQAIYENISPRLGVTWRADKTLLIRASVGRYYRTPDMTELFGDRGVVVGNSELVPESGTNYEAGFDYNGTTGKSGAVVDIDGSLFYRNSENLIAYSQNSQRTSIAQNISAAKIYGVEISLAYTNPAYRLSANYTWQEAVDVSDIPYYNENILPNRPIHDFFARAEAVFSAVSFYFETHYTALTWLDRANSMKVNAKSIHNIGAKIRFYKGRGKASFEILNFSDNQIEDAIGYPLPGRTLFISLAWQMGKSRTKP